MNPNLDFPNKLTLGILSRVDLVCDMSGDDIVLFFLEVNDMTLPDFANDTTENKLIPFLYFLMQKSFVMDIRWTNRFRHQYFPFHSSMNVVELWI